jgi:MoxR-like ATPase
MTPGESIQQLQKSMQQSIISQQHIVERLIIGLQAYGNLLAEGLSGQAKNRAIKSMANAIESSFSRI